MRVFLSEMQRETQYPGIVEYEEVPLSEAKYTRVFGSEGLTFSLDWAEVYLLGFAMRDEDPDGMVAWIEDQLAYPLPKLIFN